MGKVPGSLFLILLLMACNSRQQKPSEVNTGHAVYIDLHKKSSDSFDIAGLYKGELQIIALRAEKNFTIGHIDKVVYYKNRIYILDRSIARRLFIYDTAGNPLRSYGGSGGERNYPVSDFSIDQDNLYVLNEAKKTILVYDDLGDRLYKRLSVVPDDICNIEAINGEVICYRAMVDEIEDQFGNASVFLLDTAGKIKDFWLPIDHQNFYLTRYFSDFPVLQKDAGCVYVSRFMDASLYKYSSSGQKMVQSFVTDFGPERISAEMKSINDDYEFVKNLEDGSHSYAMSGYVETGSLMKLQVSRKGAILSFFALKNGNRSEVTNIVYKKSLLPIVSIAQLTDNFFLSSIPLDVLHSLKAELAAKEMDDPFVKFLKDYDTLNGNPVIVMINK
ncbi:MAG: 6-bladed beta-propeller [Candidatus Pseudobacter hemicellulosilyticus]|uniref:6-bladed beta-propeller n=1 Tax=Candidatus Pseudobacter hemicellulosilyticus TaxID=3121375 RepID=A0AAJ5WTI9_9BACT|nr:MAG: 6-bladed beta-propeller [Pseudobacter sp.]